MIARPCNSDRARPLSLERRSAAETEDLGTIVWTLCDRVCKVETQRPEGGIPEQAGTDRRVDEHAVARRTETLAGNDPARRAPIVPQRAGIGEDRHFDADLLGCEEQRRL